MTTSESRTPVSNKSLLQFWQRCQHTLIESLFQRFSGRTFGIKADSQQRWSLKEQTGWRPFSIITRQFYSEYHQSYPIVELKDLRLVLAQQYTGRVLHLISPAAHGLRQVTTFQFKPELFQLIKPPVFLLPESLLLANGLSAEFFTAEIHEESRWFLARGPKGIVSQQPNKLINAPDMFALANGLPERLNSYEILSNQIPQLLVKGILNTSLRQQTGLFYGADLRLFFPNWRLGAAIATGLLLCHMAVSSALIHWQVTDRKQQLTAIGAEVERLLALQQDILQQNSSLQLLNDHVSTGQSAVPFWALNKLLAEQKITVDALSQQQNQIELRASASRATDVLALIQKQSWCKQVSFSAPTRKVDTFEQFQLRIELKNGGAHEQP